MPHARVSSEDIDRLGIELYEQKIRPLVETSENIGKIISIDVEAGDYAIADDLITADDAVLARHPGAAMYGARIGYNAVFSIGGTLTKITQPSSEAWKDTIGMFDGDALFKEISEAGKTIRESQREN